MGWLAFLRSLTARSLTDVQLVISNAHCSLIAAIGAALPGQTLPNPLPAEPAHGADDLRPAPTPTRPGLVHQGRDRPTQTPGSVATTPYIVPDALPGRCPGDRVETRHA
jgi:hypothetical protein